MRKTFGLTAMITALVALGSPASTTANHLAPGEFKNVSKFCKALRAEMRKADFAEAFGTNPNRKNAFGKCVSKKGVLPEPPAAPVDAGQPVEPPLPVSAFGAASSGPAPDAKHADNHGKKSK